MAPEPGTGDTAKIEREARTMALREKEKQDRQKIREPWWIFERE
jgi:hypothetical protein